MGDIKIWTIVFLCISAQGFFLSFLLALRKNKSQKRVDYFLSAFIALFSLIMVFWVGHWNDVFDEYSILTFIYRPIPLLLGPLLFFYVKSFFGKVNMKDTIHLGPFILVSLYFSPVYLKYNTSEDIYSLLWNWENFGSFFSTLNTISILFYSAYLFYFHTIKSKSKLIKIKIETLKLLRLMITFFSIFSFVALLNLWIRMTQSNHPIVLDFAMSLLISLFIYSIGYLGFNASNFMQIFDKNFSKMYSSSTLKANDADLLLSHLISHIEEHRSYLNEDYKIGQLSIETNISSHHISELLNKYYKKSFSDVINGYRIEEAKKLLISENNRNKKVASIGYDVGFNSPSTFYSWFKKITGTSPGDFQKKHLH